MWSIIENPNKLGGGSSEAHKNLFYDLNVVYCLSSMYASANWGSIG